MLVKLTHGIDFTNILCAAFACLVFKTSFSDIHGRPQSSFLDWAKDTYCSQNLLYLSYFVEKMSVSG